MTKSDLRTTTSPSPVVLMVVGTATPPPLLHPHTGKHVSWGKISRNEDSTSSMISCMLLRSTGQLVSHWPASQHRQNSVSSCNLPFSVMKFRDNSPCCTAISVMMELFKFLPSLHFQKCKSNSLMWNFIILRVAPRVLVP